MQSGMFQISSVKVVVDLSHLRTGSQVSELYFYILRHHSLVHEAKLGCIIGYKN